MHGHATSPPGFQCGSCGEFHADLPLHFGMEAPDLWHSLSDEERGRSGGLSADVCVIEGRGYFLRGSLEIPVTDWTESFSWDVWVSVKKENLSRMYELWEIEGRESEPPYFGWLSNRLPLCPNTLNLKTMVHTRAKGQRPRIELEPTNHPLAIEQREGITLDRVRTIVEHLWHDGSNQP